MQKCKYGFCLLLVIIFIQTGIAQTYKAGDRVEALMGNSWKEVTVVKAVTGKPGIYEVKVLTATNNRGASLAPVTVSKINLRSIKQIVAPTVAVAAKPSAETNLHLGKYELYSGIPTMYIGHIIMMAGGKYKVAFDTDENNYAPGTYSFHQDTNTIEWISGMFKNNNWGGKLVTRPGNGYRIEFNKASYADSN